MEDDAGKDLCYVLMVIQWLLFIKVNKTTIVVISAHARFISAMPILLLGCGVEKRYGGYTVSSVIVAGGLPYPI